MLGETNDQEDCRFAAHWPSIEQWAENQLHTRPAADNGAPSIEIII